MLDLDLLVKVTVKRCIYQTAQCLSTTLDATVEGESWMHEDHKEPVRAE